MAILGVVGVLLGIVSGLRSFTGVAVLAVAIGAGVLSAPTGWLGWFDNVAVVIVLVVLAVVEYVADVLPKTPSRLALPGLIPRLVLGAFCGVVLSKLLADNVTGLVTGLVVGALGALVGAHAGYRARTKLIAQVQNGVAAGFIESAVAIALGFLAVYVATAA